MVIGSKSQLGISTHGVNPAFELRRDQLFQSRLPAIGHKHGELQLPFTTQHNTMVPIMLKMRGPRPLPSNPASGQPYLLSNQNAWSEVTVA